MDNIIITPLGVLYFKPKTTDATDKYFDKLFIYHDRYIDDNDETIDVMGLVSISTYTGGGSELTKSFITDMGEFIDTFDNTFSITATEFISLSGLIDYLTYCKFRTSVVDINNSPDCKKNKKNLEQEIEYIINRVKEYLNYLCLNDIVEVEFKEYTKEEKGVFENMDKK